MVTKIRLSRGLTSPPGRNTSAAPRAERLAAALRVSSSATANTVMLGTFLKATSRTPGVALVSPAVASDQAPGRFSPHPCGAAGLLPTTSWPQRVLVIPTNFFGCLSWLYG
jgi:hypothetical protein